MTNVIIVTTALAALAYYVLGALWFGPLFGRTWDRSLGYDRAADAGRFPVSYYVGPLLCCAATSVALALVIDGGVTTGIAVGAAVGVAAAATSLTNALVPAIPHPYAFAAVTGSYHLVGSTIAGVIIAL